MKYTHFDNEIDEYDEPVGWMFYAAMTFMGVAIALAVLDAIFGAERVTEVITSFFQGMTHNTRGGIEERIRSKFMHPGAIDMDLQNLIDFINQELQKAREIAFKEGEVAGLERAQKIAIESMPDIKIKL